MAVELRFLTTGLLGLMGLTFLARGEDPKSARAFDDAVFAKKAASGNMLEVQLGQLVKSRTSNKDVRKFAESMITDHGKAQKNLAAVAKKMGVSLPAKMNEKHQKDYDKFKAMKKGDAFDQAYIDFMVKDHEEAIKEYTTASAHASNDDLRALAKKSLPTLRHHLKMAKETQKGLGTKN